jgi:hypothetical protein
MCCHPSTRQTLGYFSKHSSHFEEVESQKQWHVGMSVGLAALAAPVLVSGVVVVVDTTDCIHRQSLSTKALAFSARISGPFCS